MWPVLLNMTRDDCRRTLRRLELEAYSNMISVFRAQGTLEDGRRKLLEELREALHIGGDRHSAEARRAANDELLATIAEQLSGPNTGLEWISEGRRRVPLMPRGVPQTAYTELADKVALQAAAENEEIKKRLEAERLVAPRSADSEAREAEGATAEGALPAGADLSDEMLYPPVVMEDQSIKMLEMEVFGRKRKAPESGALPEDVASTPVQSVKNTSRVSNQKHLNLSQIYSNFSKPPSGKSSSQSKHSYNQVSKVSSKPVQSHAPRSSNKRRKQNPAERPDRPKASSKSHSKATKLPNQQTPLSSKSYNVNPMSMQLDFSQPPPTFQASYAQSILSVGLKNYGDDVKAQPNILSDSPTMRLLTQPATVPHELGVMQPDDPTALQAQSTPIKTMSGKACQFIIKKKSSLNLDKSQSPQKLHMSEIKILKKPGQSIKVLPKKPIIVAPGSTQKELNATGKLMSTKFVQSIPSKAPAGLNSPNPDKIVMIPGGPQTVQKSLANAKNFIITSSAVTTPVTKGPLNIDSNNTPMKAADVATPKGSIVNDVKVSTKTFLLNPKSGQKMVVLPAKARGKAEGQAMPLIHFKGGIPTTMKLVPVSSSVNQITKTSNVTIVSRASLSNTSSTPNTKVLGIEGVKSTAVQDGSSTPRVTALPVPAKLAGTPIVRPSTAKGNVIVVQKGTPLGKTISFAKNSSEMSKIVMGKNVNKLMQAQNQEPTADSSKNPGNIIVLELNDQLGPTTTMSKILDSHSAKTNQTEEAAKANLQAITEDTPVLFDTQIAEETCNANSMDSLSTGELAHMEEGTISSIEKEDENKSADNKESESVKDTSSSVTDWEIELDTVGRKRKAGDSGSLNLELCMSSDSETDAYLVKTEKPKSQPSPREGHREGATEESSGLFGERGGLSRASRTLLSQLQDEGSSSNDSSFALNKAKLGLDKGLEGAKGSAAASGKSDESKSDRKRDSPVKTQTKRIDMFSAADINLDSFAYLEDGMDDMFHVEGKPGRSAAHAPNIDEQLSQLLGENAASDANSVSESMPLNK